MGEVEGTIREGILDMPFRHQRNVDRRHVLQKRRTVLFVAKFLILHFRPFQWLVHVLAWIRYRRSGIFCLYFSGPGHVAF